MNNPELHDLLKTQNACELATRYGVSADPGHNAGYGLTLAKDLLVSNGGSLMIISKDEMVTCNSRGIFPRNISVPWEGTLVIFEWRTKSPLDAQAVWSKWPTPRGFDDNELM